MARCGGATCVCKFTGDDSTHLSVTGSGSQTDPFVLSLDLGLSVQDTTDIDLSLGGSGTSDDPWVISGSFAAGSRLNDVGDVNAPGPTNGYVLGWNSAAGKWQPQAPTTAAAGAVLHGNGLSGDGSSGSPLDARVETGRGLQIGAAGVGLTDDSMQGLVRRFPDGTSRSTTVTAPDVNQVTVLDGNLGKPDFWDGTTWQPLLEVDEHNNIGGGFLNLSGAYDGRPVTLLTKALTVTTGVDGSFDVLTAADLTGYVGVVSVIVQPTGALPWIAQVVNSVSKVSGVAYRTDGTGLYAGQTLAGLAFAVVY